MISYDEWCESTSKEWINVQRTIIRVVSVRGDIEFTSTQYDGADTYSVTSKSLEYLINKINVPKNMVTILKQLYIQKKLSEKSSTLVMVYNKDATKWKTFSIDY